VHAILGFFTVSIVGVGCLTLALVAIADGLNGL
jgi:hypothetical protein